jgi:hypothetical protein
MRTNGKNSLKCRLALAAILANTELTAARQARTSATDRLPTLQTGPAMRVLRDLVSTGLVTVDPAALAASVGALEQLRFSTSLFGTLVVGEIHALWWDGITAATVKQNAARVRDRAQLQQLLSALAWPAGATAATLSDPGGRMVIVSRQSGLPSCPQKRPLIDAATAYQ